MKENTFKLLAAYGFEINDWDDGTIRISLGSIVHYIELKYCIVDSFDEFILGEINPILDYLFKNGTPVDDLIENTESPDYGCVRWSDINSRKEK